MPLLVICLIADGIHVAEKLSVERSSKTRLPALFEIAWRKAGDLETPMQGREVAGSREGRTYQGYRKRHAFQLSFGHVSRIKLHALGGL